METPRYRIGNDLTVLWAICNRDGSPYKLDDKVVRLFVVNQLGRTEVKPVIQSLPDGTTNNVIRWDSKGREQAVLGLYSLAVEIQNEDDSKVIHKDYCDAFELVSSSCDECIEEGEANIQDGGNLVLTSRLDVYRFGIPQISIGANGNWFIDGVDSGHSALAGGPGLVNKIYNEEDFGKEFEEGSVIDTFNAQAINRLFIRLNTLTLAESFKDADLINPKNNDVLSYDGSEWRNIPFADLLKKFASLADGFADQSMSDTSTNPVQNKVIKAYVDAVSKRLKVLEDWFKKYDEDTIYTEKNFFSKGTLASGGRASSAGGGNTPGGGDTPGGSDTPGGTGSGFIAMEKWDEYNPTLPQVLAAVLGIELHNRLTAVENGSVTPDLTPYATIAFVEDEINKLIGGADSAYDTLLEIQKILQGNEASIGTILEEIATKASKGELTALDQKYAKEVKSLKDKDAEIDKTLEDYKDRIEDLEDKESMFEWADEEHTIIKTRFDFYSEQTVASGGKGKQGQGTGSGGGVKAIAVNGKTIDDPNYDGIIELEDYPTKDEYDAKMASLDSNDEGHSRGIALNEQAIERIEPKVEQNVSDIKDIKIKDKEQDVRLDDAEKITKLFKIDDKGNLYTNKNFYSTGTVASGGAAKEGQGNSGATSGEYKMYTHVQGDPRAEWVINHGLNKVPNVKVIDSVNGEEVFGAMKVENMNVVTIRFGGAFSGTAYLD